MLIIQLMKWYIAGEKMPKRIRYSMMEDEYQNFYWDNEAEEYICEADKSICLRVPWHHLLDFVEIVDSVEVADRKTKPTISKMEQVDKDINVRSKDEPQTDCSWK